MPKKTQDQYIAAIKLGIDNIANIILEYETSGLFDKNWYDKYVLSDALLIAMHITWTIGTEYNLNRFTPEETLGKSTQLWKDIRKIVLEYTGIDTHKIFNK